ncbi:MAG: ADP-forming succinate--CoA ligase subunit beta [Anaerolineae bacterium]|nr:MAG: ADP-forming succinate--CoA ligase subunit beta [Anaerolineae bacterium]
MDLHEYQAKQLFAKFGVPAPKGKVARTPDEAAAIAKELGSVVVVKAQVHTGGRGKAGGVKVVKSPEEARAAAEKILGMDIKKHKVQIVLVDPGADIKKELYFAVTNDRAARKPLFMASSEGGMDIEQVNRETPEKIIRVHVDPLLGLREYQVVKMASGMGLAREYWGQFSKIAHNLYRCYVETDATLCEINPLAIVGTESGPMLMALDGKMSIDNNALMSHPDLAELRDASGEPEEEIKAREEGLNYVKLGGQIGCMVNGAGLAMATMDMVAQFGEADGILPANFLDVSGGAGEDKVAAALRIILSDPAVKSIMINIFGGITRCDEVAKGILQALAEVPTDLPMIIRLTGTNQDEGLKIINDANLPNVQSARSFSEAAQKAVAAVKGA